MKKSVVSFLVLFWAAFILAFTVDIDKLREAAEGGDKTAQYLLGRRYSIGLGVRENDSEAVKWYAKAAEQGMVEAQYALGFMYYYGEGVQSNKKHAYKWIRKAAEQGDVEAQLWVGQMLREGDGEVQNKWEAVNWFRKAAEQGSAEAKFYLGLAYNNGDGVQKDSNEAVRWYREAAAQEVAAAQFNLAVCYNNGEGVLRSGTAAADWYYRAGLSYLKEGLRDDALICVERIRKLGQDFGQSVSNIQLSDILLAKIYGQSPSDEPGSGQSEKDAVTGTGWVVSSNLVVTNFHVVEGRENIQLVFPNGVKVSAQIDSVDRANDLALLLVKEASALPPAIAISPITPKTGAEVFTVGYPHPNFMGKKPKLTNGIISATTGVVDDSRFFQITVPLQSGNSGGPLLNMDGQVVGVVVAKLNAAAVFKWTGDLPENVNYAIKIAYLRAFAEDKIPNVATPSLASIARGNLESVANRVMQSVAMVIAE